MNTALAYSSHRGRFEEPTPSYGGWIHKPAATGAILVALTAMSSSAIIGTGAEHTLVQHQQGNSLRAYATPHYESASVEVHRSPSDDLEIVRAVLKPAVSDLATSLGVSRQTVYNWLNGDTVTQENAISRLRELAQAAEELEQAGITINATLLKRKFAKGKTLMQVVEAGESAREAALLLVQIHKRETAQREQMAARFASRAKTPATVDFDLPAAGEWSEGDA